MKRHPDNGKTEVSIEMMAKRYSREQRRSGDSLPPGSLRDRLRPGLVTLCVQLFVGSQTKDSPNDVGNILKQKPFEIKVVLKGRYSLNSGVLCDQGANPLYSVKSGCYDCRVIKSGANH